MFRWLRDRRRRKLLSKPFPDSWERVLDASMWQHACLGEAARAKLRDLVRILVAEKNWEGCASLQLTDEIRVTIAAYAALLILELDPESYARVISILVYPEDYFRTETAVTDWGLERVESGYWSGEAWRSGVVIISWADVVERSGGSNVVLHEFAHQLDMLNGDADGAPLLRDGAAIERWRRVMPAEYQRHVELVEQRGPTLLGRYAATDPAEFFAVATEYFFERPVRLRQHHPALYAELREYYGQDPANWKSPAGHPCSGAN